MSKQLRVARLSVNVEIIELDLSSLQSVHQAAMWLDGMTKGINILINDAGIMGLPDRTLPEDRRRDTVRGQLPWAFSLDESPYEEDGTVRRTWATWPDSHCQYYQCWTRSYSGTIQ